ncbi:putative RNA methyltransferase [Amycolatopsis suaedae]|uniref:rRNA (Guanine-N1)-methyltransferase n=1 Tax=Amycolatopsis suaedae TaxID=2510978 RepID=A0A4Q7JCK7_9PSEU|nr:methyltransferase domain-containing protein [Amycolatopsis suaedae]RZQ64786.1 rRNA (guanine-N1)-methyltransferase [Amycolatopsis suaedae]
MESSAIAALRCSVCAAGVTLDGRTLRCARGHAFDLAKQGYVNLLHARVPAGTADTTEMVAARAEFLAAGHYAPLADAIADAVPSGDGLVVDAGAGTGYYLAAVLDRAPGATGLALDVSAVALRRAAKAHPAITAAVWNLWEPWPVADDSAAVLLNVFAPRNGAEFARVLRPGGTLVVASPGPGHLAELADLGLLGIGAGKEQRLDESLSEWFVAADRRQVRLPLTLDPGAVRAVVRMGPAGHHLHRDGRAERLAAVSSAVEVTAEFTVSVYTAKEKP